MRNLYDIPEPSLTPPEPTVVGRCAYCDGEIYAGNPVFICDEGAVHVECVLDHIRDNMSRREIATSCGYREGIAGKRGA